MGVLPVLCLAQCSYQDGLRRSNLGGKELPKAFPQHGDRWERQWRIWPSTFCAQGNESSQLAVMVVTRMADVPNMLTGFPTHPLMQGHEDEKGHKQLFSLYGAIVHGHFTKVKCCFFCSSGQHGHCCFDTFSSGQHGHCCFDTFL